MVWVYTHKDGGNHHLRIVVVVGSNAGWGVENLLTYSVLLKMSAKLPLPYTGTIANGFCWTWSCSQWERISIAFAEYRSSWFWVTKFVGNKAGVDGVLDYDESSAVFDFASWRNYNIHDNSAIHNEIILECWSAVWLKCICCNAEVH